MVRAADLGVTETLSTAAGGWGFTAMTALPLFPSLVAVIVALPAPTAMTTPSFETDATWGALLAQLTTRPERTLPDELRAAAERMVVLPTMRLALPGVTLTESTGTGGAGGGALTVICAVAVRPSLAAVIVATPADTPVTVPLPSTLAICGALDTHVTVRPLSVVELASRVVAENVTPPPTVTPALPGVMMMDATGAGGAG